MGEHTVVVERPEGPSLERKLLRTLTELLRRAGASTEVRISSLQGADAAISVKRGQERFLFYLDTSSSGNPHKVLETLGRARLTEKEKHPSYWVFGAPYVSERTAELCRKGGIGFIDLVGNFYIDAGPLLLSARGSTEIKQERKIQRALFSPKASRVALLLLLEPDTLWTQRAIAAEVEISLGLVNRAIHELARQRFAKEQGGQWQLADREALLAAWAREYVKQPKKAVSFHSQAAPEDLEARLDRDAEEHKYRYALTRETAAKYRAPFAPASFLTFYCDRPAFEVAGRLGLKPTELGGTVEILEPPDDGVFFQRRRVSPGGESEEAAPGLGRFITNDVYLYLDLWASPARGKEQAEHLLEVTAGDQRRRRSAEEEVRFREFLKYRDKANEALRQGDSATAVLAFENALKEIHPLRDEQAREDRERQNFFYGLALEKRLLEIWNKDPQLQAQLLFKLRGLPDDEKLLDQFPPYRMSSAVVRYFLGTRRAIEAAAAQGGERDHQARVAVQHFKLAIDPYTEGANRVAEDVQKVRAWLRESAELDLDLG